MPIRNLGAMTAIVTVLVAIDALITPTILGWVTLSPDSFTAVVTPVVGSVDGGAMAFKILTMIVFGFWIFFAGKNLVAAGYEDLEFTPASRIWWYAVPFANLVMPYQGMRELWNASHGNTSYVDNAPLIGVWWALWLLNGLAGYFLRFAYADPNMATVGLVVDSVLGVALAGVAIHMIREIARAQTRLGDQSLAEVFA